MSQNNKRISQSQIPQIQRRSSSVDHASHQVYSQPMVLSNQSNNPRMSSIGPCGRPSSMGSRLSTAVTSRNGEKLVNIQDLASSIVVTLEDLNYEPLPTAKILIIPSTATFYQLFENLLKRLNITEVWNAQLLSQAQPVNNQNFLPTNVNNQPNKIQEMKNKQELVLYHLQILKYSNIPKLNILQNMTSPKNWQQMLLIVHFLVNSILFFEIFDINRMLSRSSFEGGRDFEILHGYLKHAHEHIRRMQKNNSQYVQNEDPEFFRMKKEALARYTDEFKGAENLAKIKDKHNNEIKTHENLIKSLKEEESLSIEDEALMKEIEEMDKKKAVLEANIRKNDGLIKIKTEETNTMILKLQSSEKRLIHKEREYEQQKASCKDVEKLVQKHAKKYQELEQLEKALDEKKEEYDLLQGKILKKTGEVKELINFGKDIINKIKLSSSLTLDEFPELSVTDFHTKNDIIAKYKENIHKMREKYSAEICELPGVILKLQEEKKSLEDKIQDIKCSTIKLEKQIKEQEAKNAKQKPEYKVVLNNMILNTKVLEDDLRNKTAERDRILASIEDLNTTLVESTTQKNQVENELKTELELSKTRYEEARGKYLQEIMEERKKNIDFMLNLMQEIDLATNILQQVYKS